uniref:Glycoside hydrolase 35 catalytic domain-containing protein n=1 Tax=Acrobeloides nanus TaxID=290746 RepID=A0A914DKV4_9BILA
MRVHPGLWNDRLQRLRALGFNAVQVYVPWNLHEPTEGKYISKVQNYYNKLLDLVVPLLYKNGGPILTIQVENEYGYAGHCSRDYMVWLRDLIRSKVGNETLLTTGPAVCTEFWVNWFTSWGQTNGNSPNPASVVENLNYMYYHWNASVNFYMVHGGTNFGFMNGAGITTSYDYGALIAENGDITPAYTAVHAWVKNITNWPQPPLPIPANNPPWA